MLEKEGVFVLSLPLLFEDRHRVIYHLVFTTHKVAGLAAAKQKFLEAQDRQIRLRDELKLKKTRQSMLGFMSDRGLPEVDIQQLASLLRTEFQGRAVTIEALIRRGLSEPGVVEPDVRKALTVLKRDGEASYGETHYEDTVTFSPQAGGG